MDQIVATLASVVAICAFVAACIAHDLVAGEPVEAWLKASTTSFKE